MKKIVILLCVFALFNCKQENKKENNTEDLISKTLLETTYKAELAIDNKLSIPFNFKVHKKDSLTVFNAEEKIEVDVIAYKQDSVFIKLPVFEGIIKAKINAKNLSGEFIMPDKDRKMPFSAEVNSERFIQTEAAKANVEGVWETTFSPDSETESYFAKGVFKQNGNKVTGTFRTNTGDYRFLEGVINGNKLELSTFDGAHAFLFTGIITEGTINGHFYSGNHWKEPFTAKRNPDYELANADTLTYLKKGFNGVSFSFPDENGKMVSLDDKQFKDQVVLVQIMGTWCPNCLDESKYFSEFYKNNKSDDFEIVALAFEYVKTQEKAFKNIKRLKDRIGITYPVLLAQVGSSSKVKANDKLPMLNHVLSYPTTIFIDKKGKVRKIHTGFNGPATGEKYTEFKQEFETFVKELIEE